MNQVKEVINLDTAKCREMYIPDLFTLLQSDRRFLSWGAHNFIVDNTKQARMFRMLVQGNRHKGHVYIFLNGSDLFDVYINTNRGTI